MIAILQFKENLKQNKKILDWNKSQIIIKQLHTLKVSLNKITDDLNNYFKYEKKRTLIV